MELFNGRSESLEGRLPMEVRVYDFLDDKTDITLRNKELISVSKSRYTDVMDSCMDFRL